MLLALAGWVAGIALGISGVLAVALLAKWKLAVSAPMLLISLGTVLVAGVGFATYPARKASLITPILALQVE
jgi:putative ABC transport system permease protein